MPRWRPIVILAWIAACLMSEACGNCYGASFGVSNEPRAQEQPQGPALVPSANDDARPKVVVLGDSLTAGLGLVETQSFPGLLQKKADADGFHFEMVNAGVSGDTSAGGLRRLDWVLKDDVRVLILALGANDGLRGLSVAQMQANLSQIIEAARQKNVVVILAGMEAPPNFGPEYIAGFRQAYRDLAAKYRLPFIPFLLANVAGEAALNQADGIHPNAEGAAIVADTVWSVLKPILDQLSTS
jgi:acyl-CoA thioesterase-1